MTTSSVIAFPPTSEETRHGAYATALKRSPARIQSERTNLGQPWWRLAVQQPKCGSRPKTLASGPLKLQSRAANETSTWLAC
ncbi:hypothetical protein [Nonomuraea diastatica]|uniref:hypothetical protein n=1 Tax=Nonomuraea diastatica TaxID=1848329 RepID=UPI001FEBA57E|nr:hypothetical protein [Nonomuraea diastatica]